MVAMGKDDATWSDLVAEDEDHGTAWLCFDGSVIGWLRDLSNNNDVLCEPQGCG